MKHTDGPGGGPSAAAAADPPAELKVLRELARGNGLQLTAVGLLALISTAATLALPLVVGRLLGAIQNGDELLLWAVVMVGVGFGSAAAGALASYLLGRMGQQLICRLRVRTMRHALGLRLGDARREGSGNLVARLTSDAARIKNLIDIGPVQLPTAGITLLGTMIVMGLLDWVLLLITVGAFLLAVGIITLVVKGLRRKYTAVGEEVGTLAQSFVAALDALTVIKAYRAEESVSASLAERARRVARLETDAARMESLMVPVINLGQQIALVAVVVGGGARMLDGQLALADFIAFLLYLLQLTAPLIMAASGVSGIQLGLVARKRFEDVFALPAEEGTYGDAARHSSPDRVPAVASPHLPAVRFEDVVFGYEPERPVLRGADFTVPGRGLTAVVGLSGSGKTTVLSLIERFMTPDSGRISVHGRELSDWSPAELRSRIAYVDQASTLLQESIRANLVLGRRSEADDETLYSVLDRVGLAEDIRALPDGLETVLDGATGLSGGQRQRLALARAVLADADLVLLDEPTSHLDSVNEQRLRLAVDRLAAERAVVVVAHRISTIQHADHVIVMDRGTVTDEGGHTTLMDRCPAYAELVAGQSLGAELRTPVAA